MKTQIRNLLLALVLLLSIFNFQLSTATAQGTTAFTYQGQLRDGGTNANGGYAMVFKLYDAVSGGGQIGSTISNSPTLANGLFTVNLDFGANAFNGSNRWLEITVVTDTLSPRVQVLPAPYAQFAAVAATVTNGAIMNAQLATNAVMTTNIQNSAVTGAKIASGQVVKSLNGLTDAVTLAAGVNVTLTTNGNSLQISAATIGGAIPNGIQIFTVGGTFTPPASITRVMVEMWGGGGAGGAGAFNGTTQAYGGGGGGSGGYAKQFFTVTPGSNYTVVVGAAGIHNGGSGTSSSFGGTMLVANSGGGGGSATGSAHGAGGAKAANSVGSLLPTSASHTGEDGVGNFPPPPESAGGMGGGVYGLDSRGFGGRLGGGYDGGNAGIGGGGGGGGANAGSGLAGNGGDGGSGLVFVTY